MSDGRTETTHEPSCWTDKDGRKWRAATGALTATVPVRITLAIEVRQ